MEKNKKILNFYNKNGFYVFKNYYKKKVIEDFKKNIFYISSKLYSNKTKEKIIKYQSKKFDYYVLKSKKNQFDDISSAIYNSCKKISTFYEIISNKKTLNICRYLMQSKHIGILNRGYGVRIDYPNDKFWKARLHQDYTSQFGSPNGIVIYSAFDNVSKNKGPVILYVGSHKNGIYKTKVNIKKIKQKKTYDPYYVDISNFKLGSFKKFNLILNEKDMAVFDFKLLHKSGHNYSKNIRWSAIHRVFDLTNKEALNNFFKGGMNEGNFFKNN